MSACVRVCVCPPLWVPSVCSPIHQRAGKGRKGQENLVNGRKELEGKQFKIMQPLPMRVAMFRYMDEPCNSSEYILIVKILGRYAPFFFLVSRSYCLFSSSPPIFLSSPEIFVTDTHTRTMHCFIYIYYIWSLKVKPHRIVELCM